MGGELKPAALSLDAGVPITDPGRVPSRRQGLRPGILGSDDYGHVLNARTLNARTGHEHEQFRDSRSGHRQAANGDRFAVHEDIVAWGGPTFGCGPRPLMWVGVVELD